VNGQFYFNSSDNTLYWYDGTQWVAAKDAGGTGFPGYGVITGATGFGQSKYDGAATTVARSDHVHGDPVHDNAAHATVNLSALAAPTANISLANVTITSLGTPSLTGDAATKQYVDNAITGLIWKTPCKAATTANITLSGAQTIDGVSIAAGDVVLVKNQTDGTQNGIYAAQAASWIRTASADIEAELVNAATFIQQGTVNADTAWVCTTNPPITVGSTVLTWVQFSGGAAITAGAGLVQNVNAFDIGAGSGITVAADNIAVDSAVVALKSDITTMVKKYTSVLTGTAAYATGEVVTHNLNTRDVHVQVVNGASPWQAVEVDWEATTVNTVTLRFNPNLGAGYRVVVMG